MACKVLSGKQCSQLRKIKRKSFPKTLIESGLTIFLCGLSVALNTISNPKFYFLSFLEIIHMCFCVIFLHAFSLHDFLKKIFLFIFNFIYIFILERERLSSRLLAQHGAQHRAWSHGPGIMTWAETKIKCSTNWATQTPLLLLLLLFKLESHVKKISGCLGGLVS